MVFFFLTLQVGQPENNIPPDEWVNTLGQVELSQKHTS